MSERIMFMSAATEPEEWQQFRTKERNDMTLQEAIDQCKKAHGVYDREEAAFGRATLDYEFAKRNRDESLNELNALKEVLWDGKEDK